MTRAKLPWLSPVATAAQSIGYFGSSERSAANPGWLTWWPAALGESRIPALRGTHRSAAVDSIAGILWLAAGAALIAAALDLFGFLVPPSYWRALAAASAIVSLVVLVVYAHPLYAIRIAANLALTSRVRRDASPPRPPGYTQLVD